MDEKILDQARNLASRPYFIKVIRDETTENEPIYLANVVELEGCFGQGETKEAAITDVKAAMVDFIASLLEDGLPIPTPADLAVTTSTTTSKTFTYPNYVRDKNIVDTPNPHNNIYIPA